MERIKPLHEGLFLSTPSARRATSGVYAFCAMGMISIHALREEGDALGLTGTPPSRKFLSTPSARRATRAVCMPRISSGNFYPRPPRGGRHVFITSGALTS